MNDCKKDICIEVDKLNKCYRYSVPGGKEIVYPVLHNISFSVKCGEFVGIMGKSGCGKTTLLKCVGLLHKQDEGSIKYKNVDTKRIYGDDLSKIRRTEISIIYQDYYLLDSISVKDNIMLPLILGEEDSRESNKKVEKIAKKFEIEHLLNKKPYELSGGEKQRVAICRSMIMEPELILADEPTGNLDSYSSDLVIKTLVHINKEFNKTILLVTHDPKIASFCDRIIFLKDGEIIKDLNKTMEQEQFYFEIIKNI